MTKVSDGDAGAPSASLKIAYAIIDCDGHDGTAVAMAHVMHRMADRGHEVTLLADNADGADPSRVEWRRVSALADPSVARFVSFYHNCSRTVRRFEPGRFDIIHSPGCNTVGANLYQIQNVQPAKRAALTRFGEGLRGGGLLRSTARRLYYRATERAERALYRPTKDAGLGGRGSMVRFAPVSQGTARELRKHFDLPGESIDVVPNGADLERFSPRAAGTNRAAVREALGIRSNEFAMLFVGGEWHRKGLRHAIDALPHLRTPHHAGGGRLVVVGRDAAQPEFERLASALGVRDRVSFAGFYDRPEQAYASADVFVFPTYYEAFSLSTLEAAASGLPVITAATNGTEELIRGAPMGELGENGALIERDGRAIAAIVNQLADDEVLRRRVGAAARDVVCRDYNWDRIADAVERIYERIVADAERDGTAMGINTK